MATWTDGPEYAPLVRPSAFVAPAAAELESPAPAPLATAEEPPAVEPSFVPPEQATPDLRALVPSAAPGRNPNLPFESATTPLTAAVEAPAARSPLEPFDTGGPPLAGYLAPQPVLAPTAQVNPAPLPMSMAQQWAPPVPASRVQGPRPVTVGQIWQATTGWVLIPLLVGMFITPIAPVGLLVAAVSTAQVRYRRAVLRRAYQVAGVAVVAISLLVAMVDETSDFWTLVAAMSQVACWVLAFLTPSLVGAALRNGEPPERA
jgi:hypothetical protein